MRWLANNLEQNIECCAEVASTSALSLAATEYQVSEPYHDHHEAEHDWPINPAASPLEVRSDCA
jgi:hypothetical protein